MSDLFDKLAPELLDIEGGYVNNSSDRGGPTNHGITERVARRNGYTGDMRTLPVHTALAIYRREYWTGPGFEQVAAYSEKVAAELFDTGVNCGQTTAAEMLQRSLNVLVNSATPLKLDGDIGPATMRRLHEYLTARPHDGEGILLKALNSLQGERYIRLAEANPSQRTFVNGWLKQRVDL